MGTEFERATDENGHGYRAVDSTFEQGESQAVGQDKCAGYERMAGPEVLAESSNTGHPFNADELKGNRPALNVSEKELQALRSAVRSITLCGDGLP